MNIISRVIRLVTSCITLIKYKVYYGSRFQFCLSDRISPSVKIRLNDGGVFKMGEEVYIRENVIINCTGGSVIINDNVFINDMVCLNSRDKISIGKGTVIGQGVKIYDHDHDFRHNMQNDFVSSPVEIQKNVWIGSDVIILRGSIIGEKSVLGAASLVKGNIKSNHLYINERKEKMIEISIPKLQE